MFWDIPHDAGSADMRPTDTLTGWILERMFGARMALRPTASTPCQRLGHREIARSLGGPTMPGIGQDR
jgi:hypothetical protein